MWQDSLNNADIGTYLGFDFHLQWSATKNQWKENKMLSRYLDSALNDVTAMKETVTGWAFPTACANENKFPELVGGLVQGIDQITE